MPSTKCGLFGMRVISSMRMISRTWVTSTANSSRPRLKTTSCISSAGLVSFAMPVSSCAATLRAAALNSLYPNRDLLTTNATGVKA